MHVKIITLGCKVNQYESQAILEQLTLRGWQETKGIADLYVINTCTVTRRADAKSREAIMRAKRQSPSAIIAICGCLAQLNNETIERLGVDFVIPQEKKHLIADIITGAAAPLQRQAEQSRDIWSLTVSRFQHKRAFLKIQDGCNNACSFCKIPYVRGASNSRSPHETLREAKRLIAHHHEIVLCGINLALYGRDLTPATSLATIIREILALPGLGRLRISSLEPALVDSELLECFRHPKLCPHIHLPFQTGDDSVLSAMNKKETIACYETIVNTFRAIRPRGAISCDIMVGFPNETETMFKNTVDFLTRIRPMRIHVFIFSPREKTRLWNAPVRNQKTLRARAKTLTHLAQRLAGEYASQFLNKKLAIITEEYHDHNTCGYTENYLKVQVHGKIPLGAIIPVRIGRVTSSTIFAEREYS